MKFWSKLSRLGWFCDCRIHYYYFFFSKPVLRTWFCLIGSACQRLLFLLFAWRLSFLQRGGKKTVDNGATASESYGPLWGAGGGYNEIMEGELSPNTRFDRGPQTLDYHGGGWELIHRVRRGATNPGTKSLPSHKGGGGVTGMKPLY